MFIIVGLGNPGKDYTNTRHNIGFDVIDALADAAGISVIEKKHKAIIGKGVLDGQKVILAKPQTYMNLSGICVRQIKQKFKLEDSDIFVFVDDIDLPLGKVRFRENGSGGTHNGLRNIVEELNSQNFNRIKIGVGRDEKFADLGDFVLSRIPDDKMEIIEKEIDEGIELLKKHL